MGVHGYRRTKGGGDGRMRDVSRANSAHVRKATERETIP